MSVYSSSASLQGSLSSILSSRQPLAGAMVRLSVKCGQMQWQHAGLWLHSLCEQPLCIKASHMSVYSSSASLQGSLSSILSSRQPLGTAGAMVRSTKGSEGRKERSIGETVSPPSSSRRKSRRRGPARQSSSDSSTSQAAASEAQPPLMPKPAKHQRASSAEAREQRISPTASSRKSSGNGKASSASVQALGLSADGPATRKGAGASCPLEDASVCQFPMHALTAINDVLFGRHGYRRMSLHGDPRQVPPAIIAIPAASPSVLASCTCCKCHTCLRSLSCLCHPLAADCYEPVKSHRD